MNKYLVIVLLGSMIMTYGYDVKRVGCGHYRVTPVVMP